MRFPVSFGQQRLWFLDQLTPGEPTFNMPYSIWLDGPLDAGALQRAMDSMATRQAVLRTSLIAFDGVPEQVVADSGTVPIERIGLPAGLADAERIRRAESIAADRACQPFDLAHGPLMRATLIGVGPARHLFILVMHHCISDGATMKIVMAELSAFYRAETAGAPASLSQLWLEFGDYAVWQRDRLRGEKLERLLSYWRGHLRGAPEVISLPADRPRPARQSSRGAVAAITLDGETTGRLAAVAHGADTTLFMLFLTGFAATLSRYARQSDIVIETQAAGRTHAELDPIVGMFANTVALRLSLGGDPTFAGLLSRVKDATLDALTHQELPFEKLVEHLAPDRSLAHSPITQVLFRCGSLLVPPLDAPGISSHGEVLFTGTSKLEITMYADTWDDQSTTLTMEYSTDLFDPPWADRFLRCMATLLTHAANAPGTAVADLPLLSKAEIGELVTGRNSPASHADDGTDCRHLLQASASRVIAGDEVVPMGQVCDRAARFARTLADHGVGIDTRVGVCVTRGIDMLAALLGVWWAGGAYVPLDPAFPQARLATMASGAGVRIVVSDTGHRDLARHVAGDEEVLCVDDPAATAGPPLAPVAVPPSALACIIFTSGSTGQPRGIAIEHRGVADQLASFRSLLKLTGNDRFVAVAALSSDIHVIELLLPPLCGADLVIGTAEDAAEIGPPIDHMRAYILDEHLMPVPVGVVGEVCLAGRGVGRGYCGRPRLTARSFRPNPWSSEPGARLYLTGDLGRWREGGGLELIGRNDHQVKVRGFRIECGEIEAVLPALPLTPAAKVDRAALPAPPWGPASSAADHVRPRNTVEETLARIWSDLLATEAPISVHDNLFARGGHSLTATRFVARVADTYGVRLRVRQVFEGPTIAALAEVVSADPDFGTQAGTSRPPDLDALADEDLDELLRAALAQRDCRRSS
jgi:non-ribosomal peptide synthetase component F